MGMYTESNSDEYDEGVDATLEQFNRSTHDEPSKDLQDFFMGGDSFIAPAEDVEEAERLVHIDQKLTKLIDHQMRFFAGIAKTVTKTSVVSSEIQFARYTLQANDPVLICKEKPLRSRIAVHNLMTNGTSHIWISTQPGITVQGTDTVQVFGNNDNVNPSLREFHTRRALWAVAIDADTIIDVVEEYTV